MQVLTEFQENSRSNPTDNIVCMAGWVLPTWSTHIFVDGRMLLHNEGQLWLIHVKTQTHTTYPYQ